MKKIILILILCKCSYLIAQVEWAPIGAKWYYDKPDGMMSSGVGYVLITSDKDSVLNSTSVRVLTVRYFKPSGDTVKYPNIYTYSQAGKVYYWENKQFHLLYNFSAAKDSVWDIYSLDSNPCGKDSIGSIKVDSVKTEQINQHSFKCLYVSPLPTSIWTYRKIIEPIGSVDYIFPLPIFCGIADNMPFASPLRCYDDPNIGSVSFLQGKTCDYLVTGVKQLITNECKVKIYPNPFSSHINLKFDTPPRTQISLIIENIYGSLMYFKEELRICEYIDLNSFIPGIYIIKLLENNRLIYLTKIFKI
jgi:hypothetical protein